MKVMLLFPPNWNPAMPHLALPTLTAFLRGHGVEVIQRDLNIEVFDQVLTARHLEGALAQLRRDYGPRGDRQPQRPVAAPRELVAWALARGPQLIAQVERAKRTMRSESFFDGPIGRRALETVADALQLASLPFFPAALEIGTYRPAMSADSTANILREVRDPQFNMLLEIYRRGVLADIEREKPDLVGISIPSMSQMTPGLTIAALIKERGLPCHVTVGGPHVTMLRERLAKTPAIFQLIDSAVVFDGEVPLLRLCQALEGDGDLSAVPNLVYRDHAAIRVTGRKPPEKIGGLPLPDFDGLPLDRYLAPRLALPLLTARGCYYGKCAFCNVGYGEAENFSLMRSELLAEQMYTLQRKYGVEEIFFSDEALTPRTLRELSQIIKRDGKGLLWGGCARFERPITGELLQQMHEGGCRMILFGLESASEAIMERMLKGTQLEHMHRILRESTDGRDLEPHLLLLWLPRRDDRGRAADRQLPLRAQAAPELGRLRHLPAGDRRAGPPRTGQLWHHAGDRAARAGPGDLLRVRGGAGHGRADGRPGGVALPGRAAAQVGPAVLYQRRLPAALRLPPEPGRPPAAAVARARGEGPDKMTQMNRVTG